MDTKALSATLILLLVGAINLLPGVVALLPDKTTSLYGLRIDGESLALVIRHRAVLLACVGLGLVAAAFVSSLRMPALAFAAISKLSFLILFAMGTGVTPELRRVAAIDVAALLLLVLAAWMS
ncbi:phosphopantetheine adenylyltransferase [Myxococcus stipitatus]|uniref:phosphopantetheine adenylyltransferase n=1 Tax=Myxococcus stipitatus TaxID=83455 RepID=UPI0030CFF03E